MATESVPKTTPAPSTEDDMGSVAAVNFISDVLPDGEHFNFSKLPAEIRLAIIHQTFEPQSIRVHVIDQMIEEVEVENGAKRMTPNPIALKIDREWRKEAIAYYDALQVVDNVKGKKWPIIYIHPGNDTLIINTSPQGLRPPGRNQALHNLTQLLDHLNQNYEQELAVTFEDVGPWIRGDPTALDIAYDSEYARTVLFTVSQKVDK
ncbi:hypothetical protein M7I_4712 [Glarea lozoyensis 74030]|uniref:2EXR domain-containing protein n=1 Tax=Glarea lozoyensis (strain ATCC 74030 / MF5533) TaxID=1104152 RepID=H0EPX4_GLAL7|nr:hypothetical protein M7I_4712 [Glarea lozoyensis 74030]